ncbi:MAG: hypothetical protein L0H93_19215 [Nocardioides sp.]|nr:hypothetical protein [Nocardioides sp.]
MHLALASATRHDLMVDALFALFETQDSTGSVDTLRNTARPMSRTCPTGCISLSPRRREASRLR